MYGGLTVLDLNDLKQVFFEQEHNNNEQQAQIEKLKQETARAKAELDKAKFELLQAKEQRQREQQQARLELLQAKEQRAREQHEQRQKQAQKQQKTDNIIYITSILITFGSILASIILFITILLKG